MFKQKEEIVSAVEIGTSKICVLIGLSRDNGELELIGHGEAPSDGAVIKGDIQDMEKAFEQLSLAVELADQSSGNVLANNCCSVVNVTGANIEVFESIGSMMIKNPDQRVTEEDCAEVSDNATRCNIPHNKDLICTSESYFVIDGVKRVRNPINQNARILDVHVQMFCGESSNINNFRQLLQDAGLLEYGIDTIFNGLASDYGILSENERENGVLLVDFGAGTTEYIVQYNSGVMTGGVLQVGFEHLLNDLALGLNLPIDYCRKLATSGTLERLLSQNQMSLEYQVGGHSRTIPLSSVETIVDARLQELFGIIKQEIRKNSVNIEFNCGGVITGGGALLTRSQEVFRDTFQFHTRVGRPLNVLGASGIIASPQYGMVYGLLKIADFYNRHARPGSKGGANGMLRFVDNFLENVRLKANDFKGAIKL